MLWHISNLKFSCSYIKIDTSNYNQLDSIVEQVNKKHKGIQLVEIKINSDKHDFIDKEINKNIKALLV